MFQSGDCTGRRMNAIFNFIRKAVCWEEERGDRFLNSMSICGLS
jgi:hypothetical protein